MEQFQFSQKTNNGFLKKFWLFVFLSFFSLSAKAQCPTGGVPLYSQADVNNFATNYPNCTETSDGLYIYGDDITDLSPLSNLTSIGGHLGIYNTSNLTNLDGLSNLTSVGGSLEINYNSNLTNLDELSNLTSIEGDLIIRDNDALTDVSGLQNIDPTSILPTYGYGLYIVNNPLLSVCNLPNFCTYLQGSGPRNISGNAGNCYESAVTTACTTSSEPQCPTGDVILYSQAVVNNFATNYPNCTEITGNLYISDIGGSDITDLSPLSNIQSIGGFLNIYNNPQLTNLDGLSNLTQIGGYLDIYYNSQLTNLDGLSNLTQIGGYLYIQDNAVLENLDGLIALESINGNLLIYNNAVLTDISGLQNIDPATILPNSYGLYIQNNPLLSVCNLDNFCTYLAGSGLRTISGNAGDCISVAAVNLACNPVCDAPNALTATATSVSATLGWTSTGDNFDIEWGVAGFTQGSGTTVTDIATNFYNLTDLDYNTQYQFYVRQDCNLNESDWAGPFSFTTLSQCPSGDVVLNSQADVNAFGVAYPNCTQISGSLHIQGNDITDLSPLSNIANVGGYLAINFNPQLTGIDELDNLVNIAGFLAISGNPLLTNLDGLINLESIVGDLNISNNADLEDISGLQNIDPTTIQNVYGFGLYIVGNTSLSVCNLENFCTYLQGSGLRTISGNAGDCISAATLTIHCNPDCDVPSDIIASDILFHSATISWTSDSDLFEIEYGITGFSLGSGTTITTTELNYILTNIEPSTTYDVYIRESCGGSTEGFGNPRKLTFTTANYCYPSTSLIEGIEEFSYYIKSFTTTGGPININNSNSGFSENGYGNFISTHSVTQNAGDSVEFSAQIDTQIPYFFKIWVDWNKDGIYNDDESEIVFDSASVSSGSFQIPTETSIGNYTMRIMMSFSSISSCVTEYLGEFEDYSLVVLPALACTTVNQITSSNITGNSATFSWTSNGDLFDIEWGIQGFTQGSGTQSQVSTTSFSLSNLDLGTSYDIYLRKDCSSTSDGFSNWVKYTFTTTGYCIPHYDTSSPIETIFINSISTTDAITNISNSNTGITNLLYSDFSSTHSVSQHQGGSFNLWVEKGDTDLFNVLKIFVDWNRDGVFNNDESEIVYFSLVDRFTVFPFVDNIGNALIQIPADKPAGNYRMRILADFHLTGAPVDDYNYPPCGNPYVSSSEIEDYTLTVLEAPQCEISTNLTVNNITSVTATLGWTSDASNFDIEWGVAGFTQGSGTTVTDITTNSYNLTSLSSNTQYQFYVRQDCTLNQSDWVGPFAFTTLSQCPTGDVILGSQAEVDAFAINYPNCTEITGGVEISGSNITNLDGLSNLTSVGVALRILYNQNLTNLDGLSNLTSVGGQLYFASNNSLTNLAGLNNLTSIGGNVMFWATRFTNLDELNNLTSVGGELGFISNNSLTSIEGLSNLTSIGGGIGFAYNNSLTNLTGLQNIDPNSISGQLGLHIIDNPLLSVCNLPNFCTYLHGSGPRTISGNAEDCISEEALLAICPPPTCDVPTQLAATNITINSATLSWTSDGSLFDVEWGVAGFTPGSGTVVNDLTTTTYNLSELLANTEYEFYVRKNCTVNQSDWVGPFTFMTLPLPTCEVPTDLEVTDITADSATLNWESDGASFEVVWGAAGFDPEEATAITDITTTSYTISEGLDANTQYDFYVRRDCTDLQSDWAGPFEFTTLLQCPTGDIEFFSQADVDAFALAYPNCGHIEGDLYISGNTISDLSSLVNLETVEGSLIVNNTQLTSLEGFNNLESVGNYLSIFENPFLTNLNDLNGLTSVYNLQIYNNNALTDISGLQNLDSNVLGGDYGLYIINNINLSVCNLPNFCAYLSNPNKPRTISGNAGGCLNDFAMMVACTPPCELPTNLSAGDMTADSVTLSWTSSANSFDIQYGSQGFGIGQGMSVTNISDTSYTFNDLTTNAYYDFYVRAKCTNNESEWVGPYSFMIGLACPNDDVILNSQTEVNDFIANYPSCTEILGDLIIQGNDISDLSVLSNLAGVNGDLRIQNTQLTNLHGLHNLSNLEGDLYVYQNDELISLLGSSNLTSIQGDLYINENLSLENLSGLSNIIQVSGAITITDTSLLNLNDLSSLTSVGEDLLVNFNSELLNLNGLNNLTTIGGYLDINNNSVLENLNGLSGLTTIEGGKFYIEANAQLTNIVGLHNLNFSNIQLVYIVSNSNLSVCHIENLCIYLSGSATRNIIGNAGDCEDESALSLACGSPIVIGCPDGDIVLTSQAEVDAFATDYPYCTEITGSLTIGYEMDSIDITNLSALSNITSVGGSLNIFNTQLTSLEGLSSLMSIEEDLQIWDNWELTSLFDHNLASFDGYLDVRNAAMLESLSGFANTTILSGLSLDYTALVNLEGLSNLTSIGSNGLYVAYNILSDFSGLNNLTTIGGSVYIADNYELISFDGLNNLTSIVGTLNINWNTALSDISALSNIDYTTIEYLEIYYNSALSECNLPSFCAYFTNSGQGYIEDNAGNCNSEESIIANCGPLCTAPTNLSATNITTDSATLSWTSDGNLFDIEWGAQGFTQGSGTEVNNVGTTTYNLSGLVANTTYDFYVRQNCTINQSDWVGPFTFITLEEELPYFSSVTLSGFNHDVIADGSQIPSQTTTTAIDGDTSSTNYVLLNGTYNYNGANPTAYLPSDGYFISAQTPDLPYQLAPANQNNSLRLESGQSGALTFATPTAAKSVYVLATSGGGSSQINVTVHFDDNTTQEFTNHTILDWYSGSANYAIQGIGRVQRNGNDLTAVTIRLFEKQFVLSVANQAKNIVSVSFQRTGGGGIANVMGISIENSIISTCMAPFSLTASDITAEGLTISWGAVNNVNNYQWVLVANGADPNTSSPVSSGNTAQNEVTLSGLEQSTLYDFYVKSDCGVANGTSLWAGPFNFKVGYYNEDIPTQYNDYPSITSTDYCTPEPTITIVVPNGMQIAGLQVVYKMTALNGAWMSEQRSFIYSPTLALGESTLAEGSENSEGTMTYNRSMDFANGATGTVEFTLRAWRTWGDSGCSTYNNKVDSGTWAIIPTFEPFTACAASTTWIGTSWSNGEPTITTKAIIDGALTLTSDLTACELEVTENGSLTIPTNRTFTIKGQVVNHSSSDDFVIKSDGILIQIEDVENQGAITVERASTPMYRLDYTIWSSPVSGMLLRDFSDVSISGGSGTLWNRVYTLGDNVWNQVWATQQAFESDNTTTFGQAKGYMYRAKNAWVTRNSGNPAEADLGVFTGVPNNGTISIHTPFMFNAIGNPYPSPIDGDELLDAGATALYFWTNANTPDANGTYQLNNWAYYNQVGGTGVQIGGVGAQIQIPNGIIQPGQGFVVNTTEAVNQITFTNEMRLATNNSQFFRPMSSERHRFWLNLSDEMVVYNQILVGYMENATQGVDTGIDAKMFGYEGNAIYSIIDNNEEQYVIQGRELPFTDADVVKLGFRAIHSGSFSISLNNFDGIFEQENLIVYLKDNFNQTQHNLKNGAYSFVSEEGFFENRFEVVYQTTMSTDNPNSTDANWIVYRQDKGFQVQTIGFEMKEVEVYDILGRAVYTSKAEGTTHHIPVLGAEGVFIVKVKTTEDKVLNKKVR